MNLTVRGTQEFLGKQIPVIEGGFGGNQRCVLVKDVAKVFDVKLKDINRLIKNNLDEFEDGVDILEIQSVQNLHPELCENLGLNYQELYKHKSIYLISESGYLTLCMLMRGNKYARDVRKQFRREYFAMRATLVEQAEYIRVLEERNQLLEERARLIEQRDNAVNEINKLNAVCSIPRTQLKKDIKSFLNNSVKDEIFSALNKEELYKEYRNSRKNRDAQPPRSLFEDIIAELGYFQEGENWLDIVWK